MQAEERGLGTGTEETLSESFAVHGWLVEPRRNCVSRDGQELQLEPRVMDLLCCLAKHPGAVVTRRDLIDAVWEAEYVSDNSLTHAIAGLRAIFGDNARNPSIIETIPKRGYRLIAEVDTQPDAVPEEIAPSPAPVERRHLSRRLVVMLVSAAVTLAVVVGVMSRYNSPASKDTPRIGVLPFENLGAAEDRFFAAGITEEITSRLASVSGLKVISRTSATSYDRTGKTVGEIGDDLGVDYLLEGSVRWDRSDDQSDRVKITTKLVRVEDDSHLWSSTFERRLDEIFAVQAEIGRRVVNQLDVALRESEQLPISNQPTDSIAAYQAFLQGGAFLYSGERSDLDDAIEFFERAVELAPDFALAHAKLALANAYTVHFGYDPSGSHADAARTAVTVAEAIDPELAEVRYARATVLYYLDRDYEHALEQFEAVLRFMPNHSDAQAGLAYVHRRLGRWDQSVAALTRALDLDPLNTSHMWNMATTLMVLHRYEEADRVLEQAIHLGPGMRTPLLIQVGNYRLWDGTTERSRQALASAPGPHDARWLWESYSNEFRDRHFQEALELLRSSAVAELAGGPKILLECESLIRLGMSEEAAEICGEAKILLESRRVLRPENYRVQMWLAMANALAGGNEAARQCCRNAVEAVEIHGDALEAAVVYEDQARVTVMLGDTETAVNLLERLVSTPSFVSAAGLAHDPSWDALRADPRFQQLVADHQ